MRNCGIREFAKDRFDGHAGSGPVETPIADACRPIRRICSVCRESAILQFSIPIVPPNWRFGMKDQPTAVAKPKVLTGLGCASCGGSVDVEEGLHQRRLSVLRHAAGSGGRTRRRPAHGAGQGRSCRGDAGGQELVQEGHSQGAGADPRGSLRGGFSGLLPVRQDALRRGRLGAGLPATENASRAIAG